MATLRSLADRLGEIDSDLPVVFGGAVYESYPASLGKGKLLVPSFYASYRGFYDHPCLVPRESHAEGLPSVGWLQEMTLDAIGSRVTGWKGGEHTIGEHSGLFVAVEGDASNVGLLDVVVAEGRAVLVTYNVEEYVFS